VIPRSARFVDGDLADPPMLAVEIMSPGQTLSELLDRCERLLTAGTPVCWIIWPERRKAWTYTSEETLKEDSKALRMMLMDEPLDLSLSEMWAELPE
jgi:Uma2 family endonuclease